ncbi:hypothetical protein VRB95_11120 [Erwinia aphidicola]|uniref:hypothetical protein n=1 Tax=Erwinia aphidicola TaxID=68334 RepID=UPI0030CF8872
MINELIEQIGGRDRLEEITSRIEMYGHGAGYTADEVELMARALLAVLDAHENPSAWIINCNSARINFAETEKTSVDKIIEECRENGTDIDITPLYSIPPAASAPDGYRTVPIAPTAEMLRVGGNVYEYCEENGEYRDDAARGIYSIMIAAAPAPGGYDVKQG